MEIKRVGDHAEMQESLAAAAFDTAPVGLLLVDANLRVLSANKAFAQWVSCAADAAVGQGLARFIGATDALLVEAAVGRALAGQDAMVNIAATADPTDIRRVHCRARRGRGEVPAVVIAIEARAAEAGGRPGPGGDVRTLVDRLPVFIAYYGMDWCFHFVNARYEQWYGKPREWFIGRPLVEVIGPAVLATLAPHMERALGGEEVWFDFERPGADYEESRNFHMHLVPDRQPGGVIAGVFALLQDVTEQRSAEQAVSQAQWEMQVIADRLPALVAYVDTELRYRYVNRRFESWYQKPASWFLGRTVEEVVGEAFAITGPLLRRAARGEPLQFDYPRHNPLLNPAERTIRVQLVPDLTAGTPRGFIALMEDVTESLSAEVALRESEERLRQITDTIDDMFWLIEVGNPRSMYVSPGFAAIYGRGGDDIGGSPEAWLEWVHGGDRERMRGHFEALAQGLGYAEEYRIVRPDGTVRWVLEKAHRVSTARPGVVLIAGLTSDVTDRRRLAELKRLKEEAENANRTKSEFLSKMSHELRTPLNAVLGFAQLLQFDTTRPLDGAQRDNVEEIIGAGRHLLAIVDEMLDLTRIEMGKLRISYETVALGDVIAECVSMVQTQAQLRAISLNSYPCRLGCRPLVIADRTRVRQIVLNLLSNAIKYNVVGGQVDIVFDKASDGHVRLSVQDTGPGLEQAQIKQLFVPFQRLEAERITSEGLGLGLALSKQLAEAMGGAIGAECERGRGCRFWLELPSA